MPSFSSSRSHSDHETAFLATMREELESFGGVYTQQETCLKLNMTDKGLDALSAHNAILRMRWEGSLFYPVFQFDPKLNHSVKTPVMRILEHLPFMLPDEVKLGFFLQPLPLHATKQSCAAEYFYTHDVKNYEGGVLSDLLRHADLFTRRVKRELSW